MTRSIVDIHVIHTVPPANMNRDDTGSPKSARFGGTRRARVSSQSWKRAARLHLQKETVDNDPAVRTRLLIGSLTERLKAHGIPDEDAHQLATAGLAGLGFSTGKGDISEYLIFLGTAQIQQVADVLAQNQQAILAAKKPQDAAKDLDLTQIVENGHPLEVALFGRMLADLPGLNVDAAVQVAHALSTHTVDLEFDYFTAVDDLNPKEETGAGMIGTVEFNSATLYRFASVDVDRLTDNLHDLQRSAAGATAFVEAFLTSIPSGHQNSFAHTTRPEFCLIVLREDQSVNLVGAFEQPIQSDGVAAESIRRLLLARAEDDDCYGTQPVKIWSIGRRGPAAEAGVEHLVPLPDVLAELAQTLTERLGQP